jgi:hypothetical protein
MLRRNYLVNPRLQLRLIFVANVLALIAASVVGTLALYTQTQLDDYRTVVTLCAPNNPALAYIAERQSEFGRLCVLVAILQWLIFNLMALILSHRITGPLYRLEHHLEAVGAGQEPVDVHFRKGDLYESLATACNKVMARMRNVRA